jgi:GTPase SAR1 family protein
MISGADQGRDVWLTKQEKPVGLVQCKKVKAGFTLPDTIREIIKFLLNVALDSSLMPDAANFKFTLAVSADPAGTTTGFFETPQAWLKVNDAKLLSFTAEVIKKYGAFSKLRADEVVLAIRTAMNSLQYELLRPVDLDELLEGLPAVRQRFFKVQLVVSVVEAGLMLDARLAAVGLLPNSVAPAKLPDARSDAERGSRGLADWPQDIWGEHINRPELNQLVQRIDTQPSGATLVIGDAGTGKSALLAELYHVLRQRGQPVLAIKADMLSPDVADFSALARDLGMSGDIEQGLLSLASQEAVVLIIDQLDAVSEVMDQSSQRMQVLLRLASRLQGYGERKAKNRPPIHVIVSSRPFEAQFDARFRQLEAEEVTLSLPAFERVAILLAELGIDGEEVPATLRETLRTPFALGLYVDLVKAGSNEVELTPANLLDRWLDRKLPTGTARTAFMAFLRQLAADMTQHESLWRPSAYYEPEHSGVLRASESVGILTRDGANIGFSHQSWLDDFQAKAFRTGEELAAFAWRRQEGLFARGTILRGLEHMRRLDVPSYEVAVRQILVEPQTRRHVRHLLIDFLAGVDDPSAQDCRWIEWVARNDHALANRAFRKAVLKWPIWRAGLLPLLPFLMQDENHRWNATMLLIHEVVIDPEGVMDLIERYWSSASHDGDVFTVFDRSTISTDRAVAHTRQIIGRTAIADWGVSHYARALHAAGKTEIAIDLVADWAGTQDEGRSERVKVYDLGKIAAAAPLYFSRRFLPWFVGVAGGETSRGRAGRGYPNSSSLPYDWKYHVGQGHLAESLRDALSLSAVADIAGTRTLLDTFKSVELDEVQSTIADTMSANPEAFAGDALMFLLEDQRRLHLGRDTFDDESGMNHVISGWSSSNLVAQIAPYLDNGDVGRLRDYIEAWDAWGEEFRESDEPTDRRRFLRWSEERRLRLLAELPTQCLTARRRRQVNEWRAEQPRLRTKRGGGMMARFVGSPMDQDQMASATDAAIFTMLDEIDDRADRDDDPRQWSKGGVTELSRAFAGFAKLKPDRALRIIEGRLQPGRHERAAGAAIRELSAIESVDPSALKALIWSLHTRGFASSDFRHDAGSALETLAKRLKGLESCDLDLLRNWLQRDPVVLADETLRHAQLRQSNRENNEKPDQRPDGILFGRGGGIHVIPQRNFTILSAMAAGYLHREAIDCDGWLAELERHVAEPEDPEVWSAILMWRSHELFWADATRTGSLINTIWRQFPAAFEDAAVVQALWRLRERISASLSCEIASFWLSHADPKLRQIAGEFSAAGAIVDSNTAPGMCQIVDAIMNGSDVSARVGVLFAAAAGWAETDLAVRSRSHGYLLPVADTVVGFEAHAVSTAVDRDRRLPPDEMTRSLLTGIARNDELVQESMNMFFVSSLQGLLLYPGFESLVLELAEVATKLALASKEKTIGGLYDGELVGLAITLQRSAANIKSRAMAVYEKLLDAEANGAEEAAAFALRR